MSDQTEFKEIQTVFNSDAPQIDHHHDYFGRWPFAQRVAQTIVQRTDISSLVIGLYGAWGDGKTTIINFIKQELEENPDIVCISFNPWRYGEEIELLKNFYTTIANTLSFSIIRNKEHWGKFIQGISSIFGLINADKIAKELGKRLSHVDIEESKKRLEDILKENNKKIIIMDDIDRLEVSEVQSVFRLVKLSADFKRTTYILAFDSEIVADALSTKYGTGDKNDGYRFLEKIISVPLNLPKVPDVIMKQYSLEIIQKTLKDVKITLNDSDYLEYVRLFNQGLLYRIKTPRAIKRYANALSFALPILMDEINYKELMIVEGLRILYPEVYEFIKNNSKYFLSISQKIHQDEISKMKMEADTALNKSINSYNDQEKNAVFFILNELFPAFSSLMKENQSVFGKSHGYENKNISSSYYFDKYFSYSVVSGDIPDRVIDSFIDSIENMSIPEVVNQFRQFSLTIGMHIIFEKVFARTKNMNQITLIKVIIGIVRNPDIDSEHEHLLFIDSYQQRAINMVNVLHLVHKRRRYILNSIIVNSESLLFAVTLFRWVTADALGRGSVIYQNDPLIEKDKIVVLGKALSERIQRENNKKPLYQTYKGAELQYILWLWTSYESNNECIRYFDNQFQEPKNIFTFIKRFLGGMLIFGIDSDETERLFNILNNIINFPKVYQYLLDTYGSSLNDPIQQTSQDNITDDEYNIRAAHIIAKIYQKHQTKT
jgi:hypothetical protein